MTTPVRRQYLQIKRQYPDAILFFRLGDFYETFDEDAKIVAQVCDIALTSRPVGKGVRVPLAGVPYHAADTYIAKLLKAGYKVAICEQEGNTPVKGLVPRRVVRVVTPGTLIEPHLLPEKANNYLAAVVWDEKGAGLAYADISTGEFAATQIRGEEWERQVHEELARLRPAEILFPSHDPHAPDHPVPPLLHDAPGTLSPYEAWRFDEDTARNALHAHFRVESLAGFGIEGLPLAVRAAGALLAYIQATQPDALKQLQSLHTYTLDQFMALDEATRRALELVETMREGTVRGSLLWVLDKTLTPMGGRLLRKWLLQPLVDIPPIERRLDMVEAWYEDGLRRAEARDLLRGLGDLERWTNRVLQGAAQPRDLVGLREALGRLPALRDLVTEVVMGLTPDHPLADLARRLDACEDVHDLLVRAIAEEPPATTGHPGLIAAGFSEELDATRRAATEGKTWIANLERRERERTGIKNLKVGYNKVFGYYIEVTKPNLHLVPDDYVRKQTLVNAERFITPELKEYESLVLNAQERIVELETRLFREVVAQVAQHAHRLLETARAVAELDVVLALAEVAVANNYVRPRLADDREIHIRAGRHPVVELTQDAPFIPNDTHITPEAPIHILTGPNMAGKCVTGDTIVFTTEGPRYIKDLQPAPAPEDTFVPLNVHVRGRRAVRKATHFYVGGRQRTVKVTTRMGFVLEGTPEHRVWVRDVDGTEKWRRLDALQPGDVVAVAYGFDMWGENTRLETPRARGLPKVIQRTLPTELDTDLAYLMGLLVGDGTLTYRDSIYLSTADAFISQEFTRIAWRLFGYRVKKKRNGKDHYISSKQIRVFLEELGLGYHRAHEKYVPPIIFNAPRHIVVAFLQGLFDTDGFAEKRYGNIRYSTSSQRLAREVQMLLLNLGILASLHPKKTKTRTSYRLSIDGENAIRFYDIVGFRLPRKQARSQRISNIRRPNVGGIPHLERQLKEVQQRIVAHTEKQETLKSVKNVNSIFYTYIPNGRNVSYAKLGELIDYCVRNGVNCEELEEIYANRYFYDRVVHVETGEGDVFDLSVAEEHAYIANGFISHNSTYLRQVALVTLMAQIGSFVPAEEAHIGIVDRIFTRIGAGDEIHRGQSTFMVEMLETANILHHATSKSLVVLDEVGRGTSTYDGMSIAWAIVEYIHNHPRLRCRTLFATHYHELTQLAEHLPGVRNFRVDVAEEGEKIVFLHKIVPGGADKSYGVHVAELAGLPRQVVQRAREIMADLETNGAAPAPTPRKRHREPEVVQLPLFTEEHPVLEVLRSLDINQMTPLEALNMLYKLQQQVKE